MNALQRAYWTLRAVGWENVPRRALHAIRHRLGGHERRLPGGELTGDELRRRFVADYDPAQSTEWWRRRAEGFFVHPHRVAEIGPLLRALVDDDSWRDHVTSVCDDLRDGRLLYFGHVRAGNGRPIQFHRDHIHGIDWPVGRHWSKYDQFDPSLDDLKCVWEPSRFGFAYSLGREYVRNDTEEYAALFWEILNEWDEQNPYGLTPQWACGQESSFRAMAWLFAACCTLNAPSATPQRLARLTQLMWYTGRHVDFNINYARAQKNNHAISEAAVLWAIGLLFPEFRDAARWQSKGATILASEVDRQVYADGSYVQHSFNYHRVMMDDLLWALAIDEHNGKQLSPIVRNGLHRATRWLREFVDPISGRVPNYGANDGAQVLPLSCRDYLDFRPVVNAAAAYLNVDTPIGTGSWDEKALWLLGAKSKESSHTNETTEHAPYFAAPDGGYYVMRGPTTRAMVRGHTYRDRPNQADMLHVDLWRDGENILRDAGSFAYFAPPPWQHYFPSTAAHNTVEVDGLDQMVKGPRFLWLRWIKSRVWRFEHSTDGRLGFFDGAHYGYAHLRGHVVHRRSILRIDDTYAVVDDCTGSGSLDVCLRWRLAGGKWAQRDGAWHGATVGGPVSLQTASSGENTQRIAEGETGNRPEGWESLYYQDKQPVPVLLARASGALPVRFVTLIHACNESPAVRLDEGVRSTGVVRVIAADSTIQAAEITRLTSGRIGLRD